MAEVEDIFAELDDEEFRWGDHIERRPEVMFGKPVFKGTRLTVERVLEELAAGTSWSDLAQGYPNLTPEKIRAALHFSAWLARQYRLGAARSAESANERRATPLAD